jgi:hypothetical protein
MLLGFFAAVTVGPMDKLTIEENDAANVTLGNSSHTAAVVKEVENYRRIYLFSFFAKSSGTSAGRFATGTWAFA